MGICHRTREEEVSQCLKDLTNSDLIPDKYIIRTHRIYTIAGLGIYAILQHIGYSAEQQLCMTILYLVEDSTKSV